MEFLQRYTDIVFDLPGNASVHAATEWKDVTVIQARLLRDAWRVLYSFAAVCVVDRFLWLCGIFPESKSSTRYFLLHVIVNAFISFCTLPDLIQVVLDPAHGYLHPTETWSLAACVALHSFHMLFFRPLPMVDWVHHVVMVVIMLPMSYCLSPGLLGGTALFFLTGFPGGLDYLMLVLVKAGYIEAITEKRYNETIQLWIRAPGCLLASFYTWVNYIEYRRFRSKGGSRDDMNAALLPHAYSQVAIAVTIVALFWNGLYFLQRVVANTAVRNYQLAQATTKKKET